MSNKAVFIIGLIVASLLLCNIAISYLSKGVMNSCTPEKIIGSIDDASYILIKCDKHDAVALKI